MENRVRVRFAPAPTGELHVGGARTALFNWLFARNQGGRFILRIEDTDRARSSEAYYRQILESLRWLGLEWDEGPEVGGELGPYFQSQRLELYRQYSRRLLENGHAYRCYCTPEELAAAREEQAKKKMPPKYDGRCRELTQEQERQYQAEGRGCCLRFRMPEEGSTVVHDLIRGKVEFDVNLLDDFVLQKSDGSPTYIFACVVDDYEMGISHVIRGEDLLSNTPRQMLLAQALGLKSSQYAHVPILLTTKRSKLSKREGATSLLEFRDKGYLPSAVRNFLALLGWSPGDEQEILSDAELVERFSLSAVSKAGAIFELAKLEWLNGEHIKRLPTKELGLLALPYLQSAGLMSSNPAQDDLEKLTKVMNLMQERIKSFQDLVEMGRFFFTEEIEFDERGVRKWLSKPEVGPRLSELALRLETLPSFNTVTAEEVVRALAEEEGISAAKIIHPARVALTGMTMGPSLFALMQVLGKEVCLKRLRRTLEMIAEGAFSS